LRLTIVSVAQSGKRSGSNFDVFGGQERVLFREIDDFPKQLRVQLRQRRVYYHALLPGNDDRTQQGRVVHPPVAKRAEVAAHAFRPIAGAEHLAGLGNAFDEEFFAGAHGAEE